MLLINDTVKYVSVSFLLKTYMLSKCVVLTYVPIFLHFVTLTGRCACRRVSVTVVTLLPRNWWWLQLWSVCLSTIMRHTHYLFLFFALWQLPPSFLLLLSLICIISKNYYSILVIPLHILSFLFFLNYCYITSSLHHSSSISLFFLSSSYVYIFDLC